MDRISEIYLKPGVIKDKTGLVNASINTKTTEISVPTINSRIIQEIGQIKSLFDAKVEGMKLLFRASDYRFDIK